MLNSKPDEEYSLFYVNDYWYYFFRLHYILCERLSKMHKHAINLAAEEASQKLNKESSPSTQLRLRNNRTSIWLEAFLSWLTFWLCPFSWDRYGRLLLFFGRHGEASFGWQPGLKSIRRYSSGNVWNSRLYCLHTRQSRLIYCPTGMFTCQCVLYFEK